MANIIDVFEYCSVSNLSTLQKLGDGLLFLKNAKNLVYGESKCGKTYTILKSLVDAGLKDQVVHVDFDRNADEKLQKLGVETYHIHDVNLFYNTLLQMKTVDEFDKSNSLNDKIFVIDSLQDLSPEEGIDSNSGALSAMYKVDLLTFTGATIIIIHHATDVYGKVKVKGNSLVITSKCDTTISFEKDSKTNIRTMKVINTRAEDKIPSGSKIDYVSNDQNQDQQITSKPKRLNDRVPLN
jgi:predicted ATP-dependent serine protease